MINDFDYARDKYGTIYIVVGCDKGKIVLRNAFEYFSFVHSIESFNENLALYNLDPIKNYIGDYTANIFNGRTKTTEGCLEKTKVYSFEEIEDKYGLVIIHNEALQRPDINTEIVE